ncbi:hypothetical protein GJAV_G00048170 [Gymnothorax javanicus]|nr:hypothetical protein GJAV_G00048170 [Gymnothorax javanicus]
MERAPPLSRLLSEECSPASAILFSPGAPSLLCRVVPGNGVEYYALAGGRFCDSGTPSRYTACFVLEQLRKTVAGGTMTFRR